MHFKELVKGKKWLAVGDGPPDPVTGKRKQIPRRGKTKKEAEQRVLKAIAALEEDGIDESVVKKMTFDKLANEWLEDYMKVSGNKDNTFRIRKTEVKMLNRKFAKLNIAKFTTRLYQKGLNELSEELSLNTLKGVHAAAGMIFDYAVRVQFLKDNPVKRAAIQKQRLTVEAIENNSIDEKYLENAELEDFLGAVKKYGLELDVERFFLMAFTGMRSGELCALKVNDVLFETKEIRITKTIYSDTGNRKKYILTPPKTAGSVRTIPLDDKILDLLKALIKRKNKKRLESPIDSSKYNDDNFLFCDDNGYPYLPQNIGTRMNRILTMTNITKKATPHIFRHTHISMLTEAGVDIPTIMERVGHSDMKTTMQVYTHVTKKMKENSINKVSNTFGKLLDLGIS